MDYDYNKSINLENIDSWIFEIFNGDREQKRQYESGFPGHNADIVSRIFSRLLALYGVLTTAGHMPCHNPGRVLRVEPVAVRPNRFRVSLALQVLDNVPHEVFLDVLRDAYSLIHKEFSAVPDRETAEEVLARVQKTSIAKFANRIPLQPGDQILFDLAYRQNVPYRHLGFSLFRLGWGSKSLLLNSTTTQSDSDLAKEICSNKFITSQMLRNAGLPGAENIPVQSAEQAIAAAERFGWPVVVKPVSRERSEGVTANIATKRDLVAAYEAAAELDSHCIVERHVPGDCYRIMVVNGRIIYAVRRIPKGINGDGRSSIGELVEAANRDRMKKPPWIRDKAWPLDEEAHACLADQGFTVDSVPDAGQRVKLRAIQSSQWGGEVENLTARIHPENARLAIEAARSVGLFLAGVDFITTDITRPWHETGGIINELNFRPEFYSKDREEDAANAIPALVEGDGRIPVHLVAGEGDLLAHARALKARLGADGLRCHLTTASFSEDAEGSELHMALDTLFERSLAMIFRPDVDGLVMAGTEADLDKFAIDRLASTWVVAKDEDHAGRIIAKVRRQIEAGDCQRLEP